MVMAKGIGFDEGIVLTTMILVTFSEDDDNYRNDLVRFVRVVVFVERTTMTTRRTETTEEENKKGRAGMRNFV
jgi:tRNA nucleotidyltransferase/poly(A) polymerase